MASMILNFLFVFILAASFVAAVPTTNLVERQTKLHYPAKMIQVKKACPDTSFGPGDKGLIIGTKDAKNVYTLVSINIEGDSKAQRCRFIFMNPDGLQGFRTASVYSVKGNIPDNATFNNRPGRNEQLAIFAPDFDSGASFVPVSTGDPDGDRLFTCPAGQTLNYELAPLGDDNYIEWSEGKGFAIESFV